LGLLVADDFEECQLCIDLGRIEGCKTEMPKRNCFLCWAYS